MCAAAMFLGLTASVAPPTVSLDGALVRTAAAVNLVATQAAITMNGTFTPDVTPAFLAAVMNAYIEPLVGPGYTGVPLRTPEALWPASGLTTMTYNDSTRVGYQLLSAKYHEIVAQNTLDGAPDTPLLVFGYSQSGFIGSLFDQGIGQERDNGGSVPPTKFILVGNTNIPNGGLMSRFGGGGLTPWTPVVYAPTATGSTTYDVCRQYDPFCDFPKYPLNALALVNTLMGYLLHFTLPVSGAPAWMAPIINILNKLITPISLNPQSPNYVEPIVSTYQDTVYEFVPTAKLPLLTPLYALGLTGLAKNLDPVLRPLVEAGYDRSTSFGVPTPAYWGIPPTFGSALRQSWQALVKPLTPGKTATADRSPSAGVTGAPETAAAIAATSEAGWPAASPASSEDPSASSGSRRASRQKSSPADSSPNAARRGARTHAGT